MGLRQGLEADAGICVTCQRKAGTVQAHVSADLLTVFWIEDGTIIRRWSVGDEDLPPAMDTVMSDLRLVFEAVEKVARG